jgi:hypothetical protein
LLISPQSAQAFEQYGLHVMGFTLGTDPDKFGVSHKSMWTGSPIFAEVQKQNEAPLSKTLYDITAMLRYVFLCHSRSTKGNKSDRPFRVQEMKGQGLDMSKELFAVNFDRKQGESVRDCDRRVFLEGLKSQWGKSTFFPTSHNTENMILFRRNYLHSRKAILRRDQGNEDAMENLGGFCVST